jgi:hypothetical protein
MRESWVSFVFCDSSSNSKRRKTVQESFGFDGCGDGRFCKKASSVLMPFWVELG